ncbi:MAG: ankyrin repeat domain-containing protein [Fluviicola sp.]|nr:ankyrin repeat domain-containing protein [Fluviicola sp.]
MKKRLTTSIRLRDLTLCFVLLCFVFFSVAQEEETLVFKAVKANNLKEVKRLVESGADFQTGDNWNVEPVEIAVSNYYKDIALYLLKKGATGRGGFYQACEKNDLEWIQTLLDYGFRDSEAVLAASEYGNLSVVKLLVNEGFSVNVSQKRKPGLFRKYYISPIEAAIMNNHDEVAVFLVRNGVKVDEAINVAFTYKREELIKQLVPLGADANGVFLKAIEISNQPIAAFALLNGASKSAVNEEGKNALLLAIENGDQQMIEFAISELKLDVNAVSAANENALMLSCKSQNLMLVKQLLDQTANLEFENNLGETALFYANRNDNPALFDLFLQRNVNLNHTDHAGNSVLLRAAAFNKSERIKLLIDRGANCAQVNEDGMNALSYLVEVNGAMVDIPLTEILLAKGLGINSCGKGKETLVYKAALSGNLKLLEWLRSKGADFNPTNSNGQRPKCKNPQIIRYLIENGADINAVDDWHSTYMCVALELQDFELAQYLISKKIDLEQACYFSEPVLIKAIEKKDLPFVKFLVENKADVNVVGYFERNAAQYAIKNEFQPVIDYLKSKGAMTPEEHNLAVMKRLEETKQLNQYLDTKNTTAVLEILHKYPNLPLSPDEQKKLASLAVTASSLDLLQVALENYRFDLNQPVNFQKQSLLFLAVQQSNKDFAMLLINKGADVNLEDGFGKKVDEYATDKELKKLLKEKMK